LPAGFLGLEGIMAHFFDTANRAPGAGAPWLTFAMEKREQNEGRRRKKKMKR